MADICDVAQEHYERTMAKAISDVTSKVSKRMIVGTGFCLDCDNPIVPDAVNQRFCDAACRDEYDVQARKRNR